MSDHDEIAVVRERIARALIVRACCKECEPDWEDWLPEADMVLYALGLEKMAGYCPVHGGIVAWEDGIATCDEDDGDEPCQVFPLYRLASLSGRTLAEKHVEHYRSCGCLGDSAVCCDPRCECHDEAKDSARSGS